MFAHLIVEKRYGVALVTLSRPESRNAISVELQAELKAALADLGGDDAVRAVVFTGAGDRAFAAGADVARLTDYTAETALQSGMQKLFDDIEAFGKPTIAAVNGYALGGGCELAMACDIRIASQEAKFGLPECALAILPGAGGTQRLTRLVGLGHAMDLILTGRIVSAQEALAMGLVTRVVAPAELRDAAVGIAEAVLAKGPLAVRMAKLVVRVGADVDQRTGLVLERLAQALLYDSADKREGVAAFFDKREPVFTGSTGGPR